MKKALNYLDNQISHYMQDKHSADDAYPKVSFKYFLVSCIYKAYKAQFILDFLIPLKEDMEDNPKENVVYYLDTKIKQFEVKLLSGKPISYNTNPMVNLTDMWEFECYAELIKIYNSIKNYISKE